MSERVAQVFRVRPGKLDEYRARHATVWPELEELLRRAGVTRYSIFAYGELLIAYMEVDDYLGMTAEVANADVSARWEESFADLIEYPELDVETGWPPALEEIWSLSP